MKMRKFKLRTGNGVPVYELTRERYADLTKKREEYRGYGADGEMRYFAVCPICDNPIQIIGLYKQAKNTPDPYGKHYRKSIRLARYNDRKYQICPYASHAYTLNKQSLKKELTDFELGVYNTMRDHFDQVIYVVEKISGMHISLRRAEQMLKDYVANRGFMYIGSFTYNLPWMLMYFSMSYKLYGMDIRTDGSLYQYLKTRNDIVFEEAGNGYVKVRTNRWVDLEYVVTQHKRRIVDDRISEYILLEISTIDNNSLPASVYTEKLWIDEMWFRNLIVSEKAATFRNTDRNNHLLKIAKKVMPNLEENGN